MQENIESKGIVKENEQNNNEFRPKSPLLDPFSATHFEITSIETQITPRLAKSRPPEFRNSSPVLKSDEMDPAEVESYFKSYIEDHQYPPDNAIEPMIQLINRKKALCLLEAKYEDAKAHDQYISELLRMACSKKNIAIKQQIYENQTARVSEMHNKWIVEHSKWQNKIDKQKVDSENRIQMIQNSHQQEIMSFKQKWQNPETLKALKKPSFTLQNLRHQETKLAISKYYDEAVNLKKVADALQKQEEEEVRVLMEQRMDYEFGKLKEKHNSELIKAHQHNEKALNALILARDRSLKLYDTSSKKNSLIRSSMTPNPHIKKDCTFHPSSPLHTPRTAKAMKVFRSKNNASLSLSPVSDEFFEQLEKNHNKSDAPLISKLRK